MVCGTCLAMPSALFPPPELLLSTAPSIFTPSACQPVATSVVRRESGERARRCCYSWCLVGEGQRRRLDGNVSWVGEGERSCFEVSASLRGERRAARWGRIGKEMDLLMPHMIDTAPFRGVCQAPSHVHVARELVVPMSFFGYGKAKLPEVVQEQGCDPTLKWTCTAGDPVLHEPAEEVKKEDIGSAHIEKTINDMVDTMRNAPGVGLAAPQIGVPLQIIVLEDTKELMSYSSTEECEAQQRHPFDLLVIFNPKLVEKANSGTMVFFEGCLSVDGYRALVERHLEVEVTGLGRDGQPMKVTATGWKARILQHECDHLAGTLYVDKMVERTFRTTKNLRLPLPAGCPRPGKCLIPSHA